MTHRGEIAGIFHTVEGVIIHLFKTLQGSQFVWVEIWVSLDWRCFILARGRIPLGGYA